MSFFFLLSVWQRKQGLKCLKEQNKKKLNGLGQNTNRVIAIGRWRDDENEKREPEQSQTKHSVFCFLKRLMPLPPLTSTTTGRKQADAPRLPPPLHPVTHVPPRWGTDHGRHRLGVNRVPFIWLDAAGGPIRQPERGWGRGRPMLSRPLQLTPSLGTLQTTVKLIKLPEKMSPRARVCERDVRGREIRRGGVRGGL